MSNRITVSPGFSYAFDADGNLETIHDDAGTPNLVATLAWDFTNRLQTYTDAASGQETTYTYRYDPFGRRIQKSVDPDGAGGSPAVTTWYVWDGDMLLGEYADTSGARQVRYAYAGGFAPVQVAYDNGSGEDLYDVHTDHLDTPRLLTDDTGAVAWQSSHEAYGDAQVTSSLGAGRAFNIRFPGQYQDAETGLHYNRFRYYDPGIGRYISADPIGQAGGLNVYWYAAANGVRFGDPFGLYGTLDFVGHYFGSGGTPVDLGSVGLGPTFESSSSVQQQIDEFNAHVDDTARQEALDACCPPYNGIVTVQFSVSSTGSTNVTSEPGLFSVGNSTFFRTASCTLTIDCATGDYDFTCTTRFSIRDAFADPLDVGVEVPPGQPYPINYRFPGSTSGGGSYFGAVPR